MSEEDDTIYIEMTEDEHDRLIKFVIEARQSIEWISEELGAVMHKGKSASGALLAIKSVVDDFEAGAIEQHISTRAAIEEFRSRLAASMERHQQILDRLSKA